MGLLDEVDAAALHRLRTTKHAAHAAIGGHIQQAFHEAAITTSSTRYPPSPWGGHAFYPKRSNRTTA